MVRRIQTNKIETNKIQTNIIETNKIETNKIKIIKLQINRIISLLIIVGMFLGSSNVAYSKQNKSNAKTSVSTSVDLTPKMDKSLGLYGYADKSGKWVIKPQFTYANKFSEGLAAVADDKIICRWGYILPDGTYAIQPKFSDAYDFKNGFAVVKDKLLAATINKKGDYINKSQYYLGEVGSYESYRAVITDIDSNLGRKMKYGLITNDGKFIKPEYDGVPYINGGFTSLFKEDTSMDPFKRKLSVLLASGKVISVSGRIYSTSEGVALLKHDAYVDSKGITIPEKYSFLTAQGKIIKSYKDEDGKEYPFLKAKDFSEGVACVMVNTFRSGKESYYDRWGFIKSDGTWLIKPSFIAIDSFENGIAPVKYLGGSFGYMKKDLSWFIKPRVGGDKKEYEYCVNESKSILKNLITDSMSDYEKLVKIYEYITYTVEYDHYTHADRPRVSYSGYGALKYHLAVCEGYAELTKIMLDIAGVESIVIAGIDEKSGVPHAWNLVKINGNYYHIDATWDATATIGTEGTKTYFLKSDNFMEKIRSWNTSKYPAAPKNYKN